MAIQHRNAPILTIGQLAAKTGLQASAIRYYESVGVLPKPDRIGGKRRYDLEAIDRLLLIRFCRRLGVRISDMRGVLVDPQGPGARSVWRRLIDARLKEVEALIIAAKGVQRVLRESRDCDCVTLDSCRFLQEERTKPRLVAGVGQTRRVPNSRSSTRRNPSPST